MNFESPVYPAEIILDWTNLIFLINLFEWFFLEKVSASSIILMSLCAALWFFAPNGDIIVSSYTSEVFSTRIFLVKMSVTQYPKFHNKKFPSIPVLQASRGFWIMVMKYRIWKSSTVAPKWQNKIIRQKDYLQNRCLIFGKSNLIWKKFTLKIKYQTILGNHPKKTATQIFAL